MPRRSAELMHIHKKSRAWAKNDTHAEKLERKRLQRLHSVKSALKQKKVTRQDNSKLRHINRRKARFGKLLKPIANENLEWNSNSGTSVFSENDGSNKSPAPPPNKRSKSTSALQPLKEGRSKRNSKERQNGTPNEPSTQNDSAPKARGSGAMAGSLNPGTFSSFLKTSKEDTMGKQAGEAVDASSTIRIRGEESKATMDVPMFISNDGAKFLAWGGKSEEGGTEGRHAGEEMLINHGAAPFAGAQNVAKAGKNPEAAATSSIGAPSTAGKASFGEAMAAINKSSGVSLKQLEEKWQTLGLPRVDPLARGMSRSTNSRGSMGSGESITPRGSLIPSRGSSTVASPDKQRREYYHRRERPDVKPLRQQTAGRVVGAAEMSRRLAPLPDPPRTSPVRRVSPQRLLKSTKGLKRSTAVAPLNKWRGGGCADPHKRDERKRMVDVQKQMRDRHREKARAWREKNLQKGGKNSVRYDKQGKIVRSVNASKGKRVSAVDELKIKQQRLRKKSGQAKTSKRASSPTIKDMNNELLEANKILAEISKPLSARTVNDEGIFPEPRETRTPETPARKHSAVAAAAETPKQVPKLDLSNVEPDLETSSDEDESEGGGFYSSGDDKRNNECTENQEANEDNDSEDDSRPNTSEIAKIVSNAQSLLVDIKNEQQATPPPPKNKTINFLNNLSLLSSYTKQALAAAETALFSPAEFHDVNQSSDDDDEPLA